jgi:hypothetical protein
MEESQVASIVNITERMLPDARNIYTIGDGNEILELASRLREGAHPARNLSPQSLCLCGLLVPLAHRWQRGQRLETVTTGGGGCTRRSGVAAAPGRWPTQARCAYPALHEPSSGPYSSPSPPTRGGIAYTPAST